MLLDSQAPQTSTPTARRHVALLDLQLPQVTTPATSRHVALLDSQLPQVTTPATSRHVALLDSQPPQTSTPAVSQPVALSDLQPPQASASTQPSSMPQSSNPPQPQSPLAPVSEDSARLDQIPHRPPPVSEFVAYSNYVARMSDQDYYEMFYCPIPHGRRTPESGSEVDSSERYVRDYLAEDEVRSETTMANTSNVIGNRDQVWDQITETQHDIRNEVVSLGTPVPASSGSHSLWNELRPRTKGGGSRTTPASSSHS